MTLASTVFGALGSDLRFGQALPCVGRSRLLMSGIDETTQAVLSLSQGDEAAAARLMQLVYDDLRALAGHMMKAERPGHTLQPTAVVHEAFVRLVDQSRVDWQGQTHFKAVAAQMVRRVLIDHARKHLAEKRGGGAQRVMLDVGLYGQVEEDSRTDLIALHDVLDELRDLHERQARVAEMKLFAGLSVVEMAHALDVSERTVKGDWRVASAWLRNRLAD